MVGLHSLADWKVVFTLSGALSCRGVPQEDISSMAAEYNAKICFIVIKIQ